MDHPDRTILLFALTAMRAPAQAPNGLLTRLLDLLRPGKPTDNSFVEAFNGKVRAECIDQNWFLSLADARLKCETFRHEYNCERPHSSLGHKTPAEFMKSIGTPSQPMGS
jgi:putative transposase